MVDASDLLVLATVVQTVVLTLTLFIFIFQFRSQEKAIRESSYQNVLGRYNEYIMSGDDADNLMLARLLDPGQNYTKEEMAGIRRLMIAYGIIEEAYELYSKGWIDKNTWAQWDAWLQAISVYPAFVTMHNATKGMFDPEFQGHVTKLLDSGERSAAK